MQQRITLYEDSGSSSLNLKSPYIIVTNGLGILPE